MLDTKYRNDELTESSRPAIQQIRYPGTLCIPLTQGQYAIIDETDYWRSDISPHLWSAQWDVKSNTFYAVRNGPRPERKRLRMHAVITGNIETDHRNHNGLDNRRSNLREATCSENQANRRQLSNNMSGHVGVGWNTSHGMYHARISCRGRQYYLGLFASFDDAVAARHEAQRSLFGDFAPNCCEEFAITREIEYPPCQILTFRLSMRMASRR